MTARIRQRYIDRRKRGRGARNPENEVAVPAPGRVQIPVTAEGHSRSGVLPRRSGDKIRRITECHAA